MEREFRADQRIDGPTFAYVFKRNSPGNFTP